MEKVFVGSPRYFERQGIELIGKFNCLIMNLPFSCNINCMKCYRKKNVHMDDLDIGIRMKVIAEAANMGAKVLYIPGEGEPILHWSVIKKLVEWASLKSMVTVLYTNGLAVDEKKAQWLFDNNVSLIVSMDSLDSKTYKELTGGATLYRLLGNLKIIREIYSSDVYCEESTVTTRLAIITIASRQNIHELQKIKEFCKDDMYFICNFPIKIGNAVDNWSKLVGDDISSLKRISNKLTDTGYGGLSAPLSDGKCVALYSGLTIDTDGNVLPCPASINSSVGNVQDDSLVNLWKKTEDMLKCCGSPQCITRDIK